MIVQWDGPLLHFIIEATREVIGYLLFQRFGYKSPIWIHLADFALKRFRLTSHSCSVKKAFFWSKREENFFASITWKREFQMTKGKSREKILLYSRHFRRSSNFVVIFSFGLSCWETEPKMKDDPQGFEWTIHLLPFLRFISCQFLSFDFLVSLSDLHRVEPVISRRRHLSTHLITIPRRSVALINRISNSITTINSLYSVTHVTCMQVLQSIKFLDEWHRT